MPEGDLFSGESGSRAETPKADRAAGQRQAPLAARMRPQTLDEYAGQQHILKPGMLLRRHKHRACLYVFHALEKRLINKVR